MHLVHICMATLCHWGKGVVHSGVCKLTCFPLPECWTGIEKEIVYIQMLDTRCLLFLPPVFQTLSRHDPVKWLFTCIRRRAKALLNELLSTIQLEWTSQQHNFPLCTMLTSAQAATRAGAKISCSQTCSHKKSQHVFDVYVSLVCTKLYNSKWCLQQKRKVYQVLLNEKLMAQDLTLSFIYGPLQWIHWDKATGSCVLLTLPQKFGGPTVLSSKWH